jgi:hypothetical protein
MRVTKGMRHGEGSGEAAPGLDSTCPRVRGGSRHECGAADDGALAHGRAVVAAVLLPGSLSLCLSMSEAIESLGLKRRGSIFAE